MLMLIHITHIDSELDTIIYILLDKMALFQALKFLRPKPPHSISLQTVDQTILALPFLDSSQFQRKFFIIFSISLMVAAGISKQEAQYTGRQ